MCTHFPKQLNIIQIHQPVRIINHQSLTFRKINKTAHLFFKTITIVLNLLYCHHSTHICSTGRIPHHSGTAPNQGYRLISCHLQTLHQTQSHKMTYMETVCGRVKSNIKSCLSMIDQLFYFFFICQLGKQPPCL